MNTRVLLAILIAVFFYTIYSWYSTRNIDSFDINQQMYESAEVLKPLPQAPIDRVVAPGGPASPSQAPPATPAIVVPEETPFDPMEQPYESADMPERLRHPERMFSPGYINDETSNATASGIANHAQQITAKAYQIFGPEFATNGGAFLDNGVMGNDSTVNSSYSSV